MRLFLTTCIGVVLSQSVFSQTTDKLIGDINAYVSKVDSLSRIEGFFLTTDQSVRSPFIMSISEGEMEDKKRGLKGGFRNEIFTSANKDTIYLIRHSDNLMKYLIESYYFKNNKLIFSKIELKDMGNERRTLFLTLNYYKDDKFLSKTTDQHRLKKKYKWRTDFDPLLNAYYYYEMYNED